MPKEVPKLGPGKERARREFPIAEANQILQQMFLWGGAGVVSFSEMPLDYLLT